MSGLRTPLPGHARYRGAAELASAAAPRPLPPLGSDDRINLPAATWRSLDCGLRAVAVQDPHAATAEVQLQQPYTPGTPRESALAELLADAVLRGADHELRSARTAEWFITTAHADPAGLADLLREFTLPFTPWAVPADRMALARTRLARRAPMQAANPATTAREALWTNRFGPLGCFAGLPGPDVITALTPAELEAARQHMLRLPGAHLVVVADLPPEHVLDLAEAAFAGIGARPSAAPAPAVVPPPAPRDHQVVHRPRALQSHFLMSFPSVPWDDDRYPALALANAVFAGYFSSRLVGRIRERLGLSCHVASFFDQTLGTPSVLLEGACATAATDTVLSELRAGWTGMANRPPEPSEIEDARRFSLGMLAALRASPAALAQFFSTLCCWGIPLGWAEDYARRLRTVTPAEVTAAARAFLGPGPTSRVVVGDATALSFEGTPK
ncbi:M16 family metallopeptidase [Streptomyces sp. NPDC012403]|uniref:M16 family metallopeptidase n=1 Tax=unclassified Streptomyces TaxID=2593676 RepID=UPI0036E132E5